MKIYYLTMRGIYVGAASFFFCVCRLKFILDECFYHNDKMNDANIS